MSFRYDNHSKNTTTKTTISIADDNAFSWHASCVRTHDEILAELKRQKRTGKLRNRDVEAWIKKPSSAVSNIFSGERRIQPEEMPIIAANLWPTEFSEGRSPALLTDDVRVALEEILTDLGVSAAIVALAYEMLPEIVEVRRSAVAAGRDPHSAALGAIQALSQSKTSRRSSRRQP